MSKSHLLSLLLGIALLVSTYKYVQQKYQVKELSNKTVSPKEAILSVIHNRKSVRNYQDKAVSEEDLMTIMKAGMAAPSGIDTRPWKFIAITDSSIMREIKQAGIPAAIVVCADMSKLDERAPEFWITDTSVATQNMLLAIEGMGLGAVWRSIYPWKDYMAHIKDVLNLPEHFTPLCAITIGYPTGIEKPKDKFDSDNIRWEKWSSTPE
ncbi:nitroreductase family protein [Labilibacter marinus]|uniref:nitroreductase family protein n=1 Tax=Labilibacter marinus TaxID=1477105 RepID=UPI00082C124D|nr:nitroreductase family protein [Labilibacter marinus]